MINESYDPANIALIAALANGEGGGGGGGGDVDLKDVNYFDCFGNVLFAYTAAEYANLTAHPAGSNIESKGVPLTFDSWNYTFANAQTYVTKYGKLNIGGIYHPTDNKTHIFLDIKSAAYSNIDIRFTATTTATVDWGDGTTETVSGAFTSKHNYNDSGVFEITIDGDITMPSELLPDYIQRDYLTDLFISNATNLGERVFQYCASLISVTLSGNVTSIGGYAFQYCISLLSVTLPNGTSISSNNAFSYCTSLTIVIFSDSSNLGYAIKNTFEYCASLTSLTIPESFTNTGASTFLNCTSLTSVIIPSSTVVGNSAFQNCSSLASLSIFEPINNHSMGLSSFSYCKSLKSVTIPDKVVSIGNSAFSYASNLVYIDFSKAAAIPTLGGNGVFGGTDSLSAIIVPDALYEDWKVADKWSAQASKIVKASEYTKPF